jgi:hypothetical protein
MSNQYSKNEEGNKKRNYIIKLIKKPIFFLSIIGIIGLIIRLYYFPFDLPITHDSVDYFSYAVVTSQQGHLPVDWGLTNNGWPIFLSFFFSIFNSQNFLELIYLQRFLSIIISVLTIIPVYFLCKRFVDKKIAVIGAALFILDPRIIINSLLGITEPTYILLGTISLFLFLSKRFPIILISFFTLALCSIIRYEGFLLFIPFVIIFFIRFRKDKKIIKKIFLIIGIFFLTITPMMFAMYEATGDEGIISPIFGGMNYVVAVGIQGELDMDDSNYDNDEGEGKLLIFMIVGLMNLLKYIGWVLIPTFLIFVPIGFFIIIKKRDFKTITIFLFGIIMLIPAFYAYGRGIEETRYLYMIFPILCILASLMIEKISKKFKKEKIIFIIIISAIIFSSVMFLDNKKMDYEHESESYLIAKDITNIAGGINNYSPDSKYIHIAEISNKWPIIPLPPKEENYNQAFDIKKIAPEKYSSLNDYIKNSKEKGLTHLVIRGEKNNAKFLDDIFYHEEKYPYLIKEYDSLDHGFNFEIKMYKIDYMKFENFYKK